MWLTAAGPRRRAAGGHQHPAGVPWDAMVAVCSAILGTCVARASVWAVMASSFFMSTPHLPSTRQRDNKCSMLFRSLRRGVQCRELGLELVDDLGFHIGDPGLHRVERRVSARSASRPAARWHVLLQHCADVILAEGGSRWGCRLCGGGGAERSVEVAEAALVVAGQDKQALAWFVKGVEPGRVAVVDCSPPLLLHEELPFLCEELEDLGDFLRRQPLPREEGEISVAGQELAPFVADVAWFLGFRRGAWRWICW
eukprot:jgi/Mesvir1/12179/Mv26348-RA.1